jgi:hypothetical protein
MLHPISTTQTTTLIASPVSAMVSVFFDRDDFTNVKETAQAWTPKAEGDARMMLPETRLGTVHTSSIGDDDFKMLLRQVLTIAEKKRANWHGTIENSRNERVRVIYVSPPLKVSEHSSVQTCLMVSGTAQSRALKGIELQYTPLLSTGMKMKMQLEMAELGNVMSHSYGGVLNEPLVQSKEHIQQSIAEYSEGVSTGNHEGRINHRVSVAPPRSAQW